MKKDKKEYLEVRVRGKNLAIWKDKRAKLIEKLSLAVEELMDKMIDPINKTTSREEAKQIISLGLNHIKSKLAKPGIENEKILAEIQQVYAKIEEISVSNRKNLAEAEAQEFKNFINRLEFSLGSTKILLHQDQDEDSVIFIKQLDDWLELIRSVKSHYI